MNVQISTVISVFIGSLIGEWVVAWFYWRKSFNPDPMVAATGTTFRLTWLLGTICLFGWMQS
jgi:hypothetical protein